MKIVFLTLALIGRVALGGEVSIVAGTHPAWSRDGHRIAFAAARGERMAIGEWRFDAGKTNVGWLVDKPGKATYPTYLPDGSLVYTYGHETLSAKAAERAKATTGYNLYLRKPDGTERKLTEGRCRDYLASPTSDGCKLFFTSTREVQKNCSYGFIASYLFSLALDNPKAQPKCELTSTLAFNSGLAQPVVSPDGRFLAWAEVGDSFRDTWRIRVAKIGDLNRSCQVSPADMTAHSPAWHPKGEFIACQGFREGDRGWSIYLLDAARGTAKRLAEGENPAFSPDGRYLAYDRDGRIFIRTVMPEDEPAGLSPELPGAEPGKALCAFAACSGASRREKLPPTLKFGEDGTMYIKVEGVWKGGKECQIPLTLAYGEHPKMIEFSIRNGKPAINGRQWNGVWTGTASPELLATGKPFTVYLIRSAAGHFISINGKRPQGAAPGWKKALAMNTPREVILLSNPPCLGADGTDLKSVEIGAGWPVAVPGPVTRAAIFGPAATKVAKRFEVLALVDQSDFHSAGPGGGFDHRSAEGVRGIIDHVLETSRATTILWRSKCGGIPHYPSVCERGRSCEAPFDKVRLPKEGSWGWIDFDGAKFEEFPVAKRICAEKGIGFGAHYSWEENHYYGQLTSPWTLDHPQFWSQMRNGIKWGRACAIGYPEVRDHKIRQIAEIAELGDTVFFDVWRAGDWSPAREYVAPVVAEWKRLHGTEPPEDPRDPRWIGLVSGYVADFYRRASAECRARGKRFILAVPYFEIAAMDEIWKQYAIDWKALAKAGLFDGVAVLSVRPDWKDPWNSTKQIYEYVRANAGAAKVYYPLSTYNFSNAGIPEYVKRTGLSKREVAERLYRLAREVGGDGVVLECVDFNHYKDLTDIIK